MPPMGYEIYGKKVRRDWPSAWTLFLSARLLGFQDVAYNCFANGIPEWVTKRVEEVNWNPPTTK